MSERIEPHAGEDNSSLYLGWTFVLNCVLLVGTCHRHADEKVVWRDCQLALSQL